MVILNPKVTKFFVCERQGRRHRDSSVAILNPKVTKFFFVCERQGKRHRDSRVIILNPAGERRCLEKTEFSPNDEAKLQPQAAIREENRGKTKKRERTGKFP